MGITVIKADVSWAATIAVIGKKSFRRAFEHLFDSKEQLFEYIEQTYNPVKIAKSMRKENNVYFLAMVDDQPAGFAKVKRISLNDQIESIAQMELQKIYVLPEFHGNGVGSALMKEVKDLAREIYPDYLWLDTHVNNQKAIRFYEKNGFFKMGKYYFTIGTQTFQYHVMGLPVAEDMNLAV
jgi:ribosomal protein S18 acetylase RimI-like enzyme